MKLTDDDVLNIRNARHDGDSVAMLAEKYRVDPNTITKIVRGLRRPNVGGPLQPRHPAWPSNKQYGHPKLTPHQVVLIRLKAAAGEKRMDLVTEFGVSLPCITDIVNGRTHMDLPGPRTHRRPGKVYTPRARLSAEQIVTIRERYAEGDGTQDSLAAEYDVWPLTIGRIVRGTTHQDVGGPITHRYKKKERDN